MVYGVSMLKKMTKQIVLIYIEKFHSSILNYQNKYISVYRCYHAQVGSGYDKVLGFVFFYPGFSPSPSDIPAGTNPSLLTNNILAEFSYMELAPYRRGNIIRELRF